MVEEVPLTLLDAGYCGYLPQVDRSGHLLQRTSMVFQRFGILLVLLMALLAGCGSKPHRTQGEAQANDVLFRAIGLVGTPYRYGGNTPAGGFDCSGLVGYVYRESAGLSLPRTTTQIAEVRADKIKRKSLVPGDLVFFGKRKVNHVGIYVGDGRFVHAPSTGGTVRMDMLDGAYWKDHYLFAKRVLN